MDFIFDPSLVLCLPLYERDGSSFPSRDTYGHLCTVTGALWRENGHYFGGLDYLNCAQEFSEVKPPPGVTFDQGIATDGTNFYGFNTAAIKKLNSSWIQIASNDDPHTDIGEGTTHLADGDYYNSKIYIPAEIYSSCESFSKQHITVWNASDLSFDSKHDISAQGFELGGLCVAPDDGDNGIIYVVGFCDGTKIWKYDLGNFSYLGSISLSESSAGYQGITKIGNYLYLVRASMVNKVQTDGTIIKKSYIGAVEGICFHDGKLYGLDSNGDVRVFNFHTENIACISHIKLGT